MIDHSSNLAPVGHCDLAPDGAAMQVLVKDGYAYVGHVGKSRYGTSIVDVRDPRKPQVVARLHVPLGTHSHKVQLNEDFLYVNYERNWHEKPHPGHWKAGMGVFDVKNPRDPKEVGFFPMEGMGTHRMAFVAPSHVFLSGSAEGYIDQFLQIIDVSRPTSLVEVGRWWLEGMAEGEEMARRDWPRGRRYACHHPVVRGARAYCGWWDAGAIILDISDISSPRLVSRMAFPENESHHTHTALPLPGRDALLVVDEQIEESPDAKPQLIRVVDILDERNPRVIGKLPTPVGGFARRPGRFGPHNLHEMQPGSWISSDVVFATFFNAGLRVYDVSDIWAPSEIGHFTPDDCLVNDLYVSEDGLVYLTDRAGSGLYIAQWQPS